MFECTFFLVELCFCEIIEMDAKTNNERYFQSTVCTDKHLLNHTVATSISVKHGIQ